MEFGYGSIKLLRDADVLKSEFLRDVRKALDNEASMGGAVFVCNEACMGGQCLCVSPRCSQGT